MRLAALAALLLAAAPAPAQDDVAALQARIAELEAQAAQDAETIANLRARLAEKPLDPTGAATLNNRIKNQNLEIGLLRQGLNRCESDLASAASARDAAERRITEAERRERSAAQDAQRARRDEARAERDLRRAQSRLRSCR
jgi:chromosome segregation ATPase